MEQMKATYEKLNENQRELLATLNAKMQEAMQLFEPDAKVETFVQEMMETSLANGKTYLSTLAAEDQPEQFMQTYLSAFQQWADSQATSYEKAMEFFSDWWEQYRWDATNAHFTKLGELYQASMEAIWKTSTENAKLMQGMFFANV
jgi:hypothetical protein